MTRKRTSLIFFLAVLAVLALTPRAVLGDCGAAQVAAVGTLSPRDPSGAASVPQTVNPFTEAVISNEGLTERVDNILITESGAGFQCFATGRQFIVTFNAALTVPSSISSATNANFDIFDNAGTGGLVITASSQVGLSSGGTPQTVITITVLQAGSTTLGTGIRVKNIRVDATATAPTTHVTAVASATAIPSASPAFVTAPINVGLSEPTVAAGSAITPAGPPQGGIGTQSSNGPLTTQAVLTFAENGANSNAFRTASTTIFVNGDIATTPTSIIFDVTNAISGVTITFPTTLTNSAGTGTPPAPNTNLAFRSRTGSSVTATGANMQVIYDTVTNGSSTSNSPSTMVVTTGAASSDVTATVGVTIGSVSGFGTASLRLVFGPGAVSAFTGDDASASAVPRYLQSVGSAAPTRRILGTNTWFTINATRTVLLYRFASNQFGFETGIAVTNSGSDSTVFGTTGQSGSITFTFFPSVCAGSAGCSFQVTAAAAAAVPAGTGIVARGLSAGLLSPGAVFVSNLRTLLTAAGAAGAPYLNPGPASAAGFDGYIIADCQFNFGHGVALAFTSGQLGQLPSWAAIDALVLGSGTRIGGTPEQLRP